MIAIEMMPENISVMRKNVEANKLSKVIEIVEAGAWDSKGTRLARTKGLQRSSLNDVRSVEDGEELELPVDTLDNILGGLGVERVGDNPRRQSESRVGTECQQSVIAERNDQLINKLDCVQGRVRPYFEISTWTIRDFLGHVWQHMVLLLALAGAFLALRVYVVAAVIQAIRRIGHDAGRWSGTIPAPVVGDIPIGIFAIIVWVLVSFTAAVACVFQKRPCFP